MTIRNTLGIVAVAVFMAATLFAGGCATSGSTQQTNRSDWEWVPYIWVEGDITGQYRNCAYDEESTGYFCPPGTI